MFDFGGLFGAIGSIAGSAIQASAIKKATQMQIKALERQKKFVFDNLKPSVVQEEARAADVERAQARLALQSQIDPALLAARYVSQDQLLKLAKEGAESSGDKLAAQLFEEAPAPAAYEVICRDTTGAGDVFHAAFIRALFDSWDLMRSLDFSYAVAALKCTDLGGRAALPSFPEAVAFMETGKRRSVRDAQCILSADVRRADTNRENA